MSRASYRCRGQRAAVRGCVHRAPLRAVERCSTPCVATRRCGRGNCAFGAGEPRSGRHARRRRSCAGSGNLERKTGSQLKAIGRTKTLSGPRLSTLDPRLPVTMSAIDEDIVREYFEHNGFLVRQVRKHAVQSRKKSTDDELIDLLVLNPAFVRGERRPDFFLFTSEFAFRASRDALSERLAHVCVLSGNTADKQPGHFSFPRAKRAGPRGRPADAARDRAILDAAIHVEVLRRPGIADARTLSHAECDNAQGAWRRWHHLVSHHVAGTDQPHRSGPATTASRTCCNCSASSRTTTSLKDPQMDLFPGGEERRR